MLDKSDRMTLHVRVESNRVEDFEGHVQAICYRNMLHCSAVTDTVLLMGFNMSSIRLHVFVVSVSRP